MNNKHQPLEYTALEVADILRHALSNVLQRLPEDDRGRWLDVREQCDASLRAIRGLEEPQDGTVAEVLDLAHAYADAKLMRYGLLGIRNSPDPQAAFEALREAVVSAVVVQPAVPDIYVHTDGLSVWGAAANPELANDPAFTAYYSIPPSTNRALRMALAGADHGR